MRASVIGILGVAAIAAGTAISVALKPGQDPPPAAAAATPDQSEAEASRGEAPWPTTGMSQSAGQLPPATPADLSQPEQGEEPALRRAQDRSQLTSEELKAQRDERRAQREMLRAERQRAGGGNLRGARRSSKREDYAEQRAKALEAARAQPQVESLEEPPAEEPPPDEPLSDQMEAEVPLEPDDPPPEEPS